VELAHAPAVIAGCDGGPTGDDRKMMRPPVVVQPKPCQVVFQPPALDDAIFRSAFQEFRQKMLIGTC
jgi:hypothetical protein